MKVKGEISKKLKVGTKPVGTGAVDYDVIVAPAGRHRLLGGKWRQSGKVAEEG